MSRSCIWKTGGATRIVLLTRKYAWKFPQVLCGWRNFLYGMLSNDYEKKFWRMVEDETILAPIYFSLPLGLLVVMHRCDPVPRERYDEFDHKALTEFEDFIVPSENKIDSFGLHNGNIVAIDYGGRER